MYAKEGGNVKRKSSPNIGRCYTMAKPVDTLLGEFHAQRGTRYAIV